MAAPEGNKNGENGKRFRLALERAIAEQSKGQDKWLALVDVAKKLVEEANNGNISAIKEVADRLDGKSAQAVAVTGADGGALVIQVLKFADTDT